MSCIASLASASTRGCVLLLLVLWLRFGFCTLCDEEFLLFFAHVFRTFFATISYRLENAALFCYHILFYFQIKPTYHVCVCGWVRWVAAFDSRRLATYIRGMSFCFVFLFVLFSMFIFLRLLWISGWLFLGNQHNRLVSRVSCRFP